MTAKEKARELVVRFGNALWSDDDEEKAAKKCAIICCDEILKEASGNIYTVGRNNLSNEEYWQSVKKEVETMFIQKLNT